MQVNLQLFCKKNKVFMKKIFGCFHNLNTLAAEICTFNGEAKIIRQK